VVFVHRSDRSNRAAAPRQARAAARPSGTRERIAARQTVGAFRPSGGPAELHPPGVGTRHDPCAPRPVQCPRRIPGQGAGHARQQAGGGRHRPGRVPPGLFHRL
jgi:hypothetical protein